MEEWGSILLKFYNKNTSLKNNDITQTHLSYWTDNGLYSILILVFIIQYDLKLANIFFERCLLLLDHWRQQRLSNNNLRCSWLFDQKRHSLQVNQALFCLNYLKMKKLKIGFNFLSRSLQYDSWWYGSERGCYPIEFLIKSKSYMKLQMKSFLKAIDRVVSDGMVISLQIVFQIL